MPGAEADTTLAQGIQALRDERLDEAQAFLTQVLEADADHVDALHFLGVLRHVQGRSDEGIELIQRSLQRQPGHSGAWNNLGNVYVETQRLDEAFDAYRRSVDAAGAAADVVRALNNLGTLHRRAGRLDDAEACCREAVARDPGFGDAWYNLSQTLMAQGCVHEGLIANSRAVALWPRHLLARDQVLRALLLLGERTEAARLYREWLAEEPANPVVQHQLAACLGEDTPARASDAYVEQLFDAFARSFDAKLQKLHYRAPSLVAAALDAAVGAPAAVLDIVDAGCGTGLCGPLLRPWARRLAGCDLSVGMLRQARPRGVYDVLHKAELCHYLSTQPQRFDAVVSADTLCYFGDLGGAFAAAVTALRPGGWLIFTVEAASDEQAAGLQVSGRYAHAADYLELALGEAGLAERHLEGVVLRSEAGRDVAGWLVSARTAATAAA